MKKLGLVLSLSIVTSVFAAPKISIYYSLPTNPSGVKVIEDGHDTSTVGMRLLLAASKSHKNAYQTIKKVTDYFEREFGLNSYDGHGSDVNAIVGFGRLSILSGLGPLKENAAWYADGKVFLLGSGGKYLDSFEKEVDVIAHEYFHAVTDSSTKLQMVGQTGALSESISDIFGEMIDQELNPSAEKWVIGQSIFTEQLKKHLAETGRTTVTGLRNMMFPERSLTPQPSSVRMIPRELDSTCAPSAENDYCGVHILNGIPNRAMAMMVQSLGWKKMKPIFFDVATQKLNPRSDFHDFANQIQNSCYEKLDSSDCQTIREILAIVGF